MRSKIFDLAARPMAISEREFRSLLARAVAMPQAAAGDVGGARADGFMEYFFGAAPVREENVGRVRVIYVCGVIDRYVPQFYREWGYADVELVDELVRAAAVDDGVEAIVLAINSPGGCVYGVPEVAELIADVGEVKPVVAHASNLMASAGYYLAAGASVIVADPSAEVGSVGVYAPMYDFRGMFDEMGISVELAKTGELKGAGYPGTEWTDDQKNHEREVVGDYYAAFRAHVLAHRDIAADRLTGGCYVAGRALEYGFVDDLGSLGDAIQLAADLGGLKQNA